MPNKRATILTVHLTNIEDDNDVAFEQVVFPVPRDSISLADDSEYTAIESAIVSAVIGELQSGEYGSYAARYAVLLMNKYMAGYRNFCIDIYRLDVNYTNTMIMEVANASQ